MTFGEAKSWIARNQNVVFFVGGFLFDALTLVRIDSILDLALQAGYLAAITYILIKQVRVERGIWQPTGFTARLWKYETEFIHFFYGGLLSAYVVLYFKSTTGPKSIVFLGLTLALMFANEMPQIKAAGSRMRLGLHAFCVVSFLNYLVPILFGRMGLWTFILAVLLTCVASYSLVRHLVRLTPDPTDTPWSLGWPSLLVLTLICVFYYLKWIPPVPLSMQFAGVYHEIRKDGPDYYLRYPKPPWYRFWTKQSRPFMARPGDSVICFARIFAPRRFTHEIYMRWSMQQASNGKYITSDLIPFPIYGGRGQGYRGYAAKANYTAGWWKVDFETSDGRVIGSSRFEIKPDGETETREWREQKM